MANEMKVSQHAGAALPLPGARDTPSPRLSIYPPPLEYDLAAKHQQLPGKVAFLGLVSLALLLGAWALGYL